MRQLHLLQRSISPTLVASDHQFLSCGRASAAVRAAPRRPHTDRGASLFLLRRKGTRSAPQKEELIHEHPDLHKQRLHGARGRTGEPAQTLLAAHLHDAIMRSQQRRAEREIAAYLRSHGGLLTDGMEREIMLRLEGRRRGTL